ncbi:MAG: zinc-finger family protein, partial [Ramlibacter sp.]|nr:zinc-finger family protein [Ramlibacter sp.]
LPAAPVARPDARRNWFAWPAFASGMAAVAMALAAVQWVWLPQREDALIQQEVLASHSRAVLSQRLVDVASSNHHTIKPWLSARLDFSPPVDEPAGPATQLLGARIDYIAGRPVAALVLRHAGHTAESFVWPVQGRDQEAVLATERGFQIAHWTRGGMRHWLISDVSPAEFARLVRDVRGAG